MHWHLIHTKPRQETCALQNLEQQGYTCYLPILVSEKLRQGRVQVESVPLFPRYLFIQLDQGLSAPSWAPIRSTRGVSRLVSFGNVPARIDATLVDTLRVREQSAVSNVRPLFAPGDRVTLTKGAFAGLDAVYQMSDGDSRVIVLLEILSKTVRLQALPADVRMSR